MGKKVKELQRTITKTARIINNADIEVLAHIGGVGYEPDRVIIETVRGACVSALAHALMIAWDCKDGSLREPSHYANSIITHAIDHHVKSMTQEGDES